MIALKLHTGQSKVTAKAKQLFYEAMELQGDARQPFIDQACGDDESLRQSVTRLLASLDVADDRLEDPAFADSDLLSYLDITPPAGADAQKNQTQSLALRTNLESLLEPTDRKDCLGLIDGYDVIEKIGEGGMGVVFRARDPKLQRDVAIKLLAPELAVDETSHDDFLHEARALAAVRNPHVVQIFAVDEFKGMPYLVMECIEGVTLAQRINSQGSLPIEDVTRIAMQIATGLTAVHAHGMTHRDIKPANVMLESGSGNVKIADFGLAHTTSNDQQSGRPHGTPHYMSPEQATGEPVDARSDLFSLGTVLFSMCTGESPFQAETTASTITRVCKQIPPKLRSVNPSTPAWFSDLVCRLLEKDPAKRIQTADELLRVIAEHTERKRSRTGVAALSILAVFCVAVLSLIGSEWQGWTNVTGWFNNASLVDTSRDGPRVGGQTNQNSDPAQPVDDLPRNLTPMDILSNDEWTWSAPKAVRSTSGRGTITISPCLAGDGLALYFSQFAFRDKERERDIWVCRRIAAGAPFGEAAPLEGLINTPANESGVAVSNDELTIIFSSDRDGSMGQSDLWIAHRSDVHQPWPAPQPMGEEVNSEGDEIGPWLSHDGLVLLFAREQDIHMSTRTAKAEPFSQAHPLGLTVNTSGRQNAAWMSRDHLSLVVTARQQTGSTEGSYDMWLFTRDAPDTLFSNPTNLGEPLNSATIDGHPTFSPDGRTVYFHSKREGSTCIFESRRVKNR